VLKTRGANPVTDGGGDLLRFNRPARARAYAAKFHPCEASSLYHADRNARYSTAAKLAVSPHARARARVYVYVCVEKATL